MIHWFGTIFGPWVLRFLGVDYPQRPAIELIEGDGVTIGVVDDPTSGATKVTIATDGGGAIPEPGAARNFLISDGTDWTSRPATLDDLGPAFGVTMAGAQTVEVGSSVATPAFTASYVGGPATSVALTDTEGTPSKNVTSTPTSFTSNGTFSKSVNGQSVTFTTTASKGSVGPKTSSVTITWQPRVYFGATNPGTFNEAFIEALASNPLAANRVRTFTVNATGAQKIYYAFPTSYGTPTFKVGGFEGGFEKVGTAVSVTNANGVVQTYDVWASVNAGLGSTTVEVT